jgi:hypothetical protein
MESTQNGHSQSGLDSSEQADTSGNHKPIRLPEPDTDNITVLTKELPNDPILPWHRYDSPWLEPEAEEPTAAAGQTAAEPAEVEATEAAEAPDKVPQQGEEEPTVVEATHMSEATPGEARETLSAEAIPSDTDSASSPALENLAPRDQASGEEALIQPKLTGLPAAPPTPVESQKAKSGKEGSDT